MTDPKPIAVTVTLDIAGQDKLADLVRAHLRTLSPPTPTIAEAADLVTRARQRLAGLLTEACPGPHRFVQHRDHRPPWCDACRYTPDGQPVPPREAPEMGA